MKQSNRRWLGAALVFGAVVGLGFLAWAAPMMPQRPSLPDSWLSLAAAKRIVLEVFPIPSELKNVGITTEGITQEWKEKLREAGFEPTERGEADVPVLQLTVLSGTEDDLKDILLTVMYLTYIQPARFDGIDRTLRVPTYAHPLASMEPRSNLGRSVRGDLDNMIRQFIERSRLAHEQIEVEKETEQ